ncbi:egg protein CP391S-like [Schistosoma mansoni]|uniref:egg protein CP391S-like n=1 Tax=Schistosoma mansoni TaxID=6183 RepID=UPI00022DC443|nr:egg protein CP391S-like [Schistosoma mansoni]|eukprot:XP_018652514.1 egg protein CP391S-like [Schistosoma mansoni]
MRYNFSPSLRILIYLIFVWPYKRFNCNDICNNADLRHHEIVIIENDTYRYSLHYNYSMRIQRNQSQSVPSEHFYKIYDKYWVYPRFSFSYYGKHVKQIDFHEDHKLYDFGGYHIGTIINYIKNYEKYEAVVLDEKKLLGVQRNFSINVNGTEVTATMTTLIHPNGMVSFYYDNIPTENEEIKLLSGIVGSIRCEGGYKYPGIRVPAKWIKSGTLVEFEAIGEICSQYNRSETCQRATTLTMTCFWCEKGGKCIESNDQNTHVLKVNDCSVEKSDINDLNSSTTMEHIETTLGITEVQVSENLMKTTGETDKDLVNI